MFMSQILFPVLQIRLIKCYQDTFETFPNTFTTRRELSASGNPINDSFSEITTPEIQITVKEKEILNILVIGGARCKILIIQFLNAYTPLTWK